MPASRTVSTPSRCTGTATTSPGSPLASSRASAAAPSTPSAARASAPAPITGLRRPPGVTGRASAAAPASGPAEVVNVGRTAGSANGGLQRISERRGLVRSQLDDEPATTLEGHAHHDAATLLGDLQGTVAGPRLHRRHA